MVNEAKLSEVLSDFARTLTSEFAIQGILDHLVRRMVEVLPVTAAGVTLLSPGSPPRYLAASDGAALRFERLQTNLGEGPCHAAFDTGTVISVDDLHHDARFPEFSPAAVEAGLGAVFTFPLGHGEVKLGALNLYRDRPGGLDPNDLAAAQTMADVAAAYLFNAQVREEARATTDIFRHSSLHDALTGLPNRLLLEERLEHAAQRARRSRMNVAILFADLDRFKQVNDKYGHRTGDALLSAVARRLARVVRPGDTLARVSGDEFVFLCEDMRDLGDVEILARRIDLTFADAFFVAGTSIKVTASVGMAFSGTPEGISDELIVEADMAMYQAKRKGGAGHQLVDLREAFQSDDRANLERDLHRAYAQDELEVAYQPIVRTSDGLVTGVEALLRWNDQARGSVSALAMIELSEQSGLIHQIGRWVLERSCTDRGQWLLDHPRAPLDLSVNVSARQLLQSSFVESVKTTLMETGMDPGALTLELTETVLIDDMARAIAVMVELTKLGVRLAMDDFGTGYSSLNYLRKLPLDSIKIDNSIIADIDLDPTGRGVVAAVTKLAQLLGLTVTAEGVETEIQRDGIAAIGCELAQGYFYAHPMPAAAIASLLDGLDTHRLRLPPSLDEALVIT
jgi:diguanylate cyclase (GGDEF)-like protein